MSKPDEAGVVPILEYHALVDTTHVTGYEYYTGNFKRDLNWLYQHRFRPIGLSDYVHGIIDVPAGMSPVVLTFDDALKTQFAYTASGQIAPDCAVGILNSFHKQHPDWALRGTFFVLTDESAHLPAAFYQKKFERQKMQYLVREGFEIGNHTVHHRMGMRTFPDTEVEAEFAGAVANIHKLLPGYDVSTLALPYGVYPKNRKLVIDGASGGQKYHDICAMLAGANPAPSPMSVRFNPYLLPRIIPGEEDCALAFWFRRIAAGQTRPFVSDGDPMTYTVAAKDRPQLNLARLEQDHFRLRAY